MPEKLFVSANKTYRHGFILSEQEVRRLVGLISDQLTKASTTYNLRFQFRFRNGVTASSSSLDDVLSQENIGSAAITRLEVEGTSTESDPLHRVTVEFINADEEDEPRSVSIRYRIHGESRDWVFVTSSLIEERIQLVRRFAPNELSELARFVIPLLMVLILIPMAVFTVSRRAAPIDSIEEAWRSKRLADPVEAIILLEKAKTQRVVVDSFQPIAILTALLLGLILTSLFFFRYYPVFNFYWGDYMSIFDSRERTRKFVLSVIVVGLIVSIIAGLVVEYVA